MIEGEPLGVGDGQVSWSEYRLGRLVVGDVGVEVFGRPPAP
jgi:hypothetical protein